MNVLPAPKPPIQASHDRARRQVWTRHGRLTLLAASYALLLAFFFATRPGVPTLLGALAAIAITAPIASFYLVRRDDALRPLSWGQEAEDAALEALKDLPDTTALLNYRHRGNDRDVDILLVGPMGIVLLEIKGLYGQLDWDGATLTHRRDAAKEPVPRDITRLLQRRTTDAVRLKLHLIRGAQENRVPKGIPTPTSLLVFHDRRLQANALPPGAVLLRDLAQTVHNLPPQPWQAQAALDYLVATRLDAP